MHVPMTFTRMIRQPSAFVPIAMSLLALATVALHVARFGVTPEPDEGTAAHIWQLLMAAQFPVIAYFAINWLPRSPRDASRVRALQVGAALAALAPVVILGF